MVGRKTDASQNSTQFNHSVLNNYNFSGCCRGETLLFQRLQLHIYGNRFLSLTPDIWDKLKKDPDDKEVAMELSWVVDLAADYTVIYEAFCKDEK